jgi:glycerophosphoryl diester phosphodiesterase
VNPSHRVATAAYVDAVHAAGMRCQVWTVNRRADLLRAVDLGVDGVITNRPDVLQRLLATREALLG